DFVERSRLRGHRGALARRALYSRFRDAFGDRWRGEGFEAEQILGALEQRPGLTLRRERDFALLGHATIPRWTNSAARSTMNRPPRLPDAAMNSFRFSLAPPREAPCIASEIVPITGKPKVVSSLLAVANVARTLLTA